MPDRKKPPILFEGQSIRELPPIPYWTPGKKGFVAGALGMALFCTVLWWFGVIG
ncbi:hypothetical protein GN330_12040 [Nitratireductor sp. CAU 1489]|uniref:Uncharacterized protein n=1 Tax=Nitratireductor arenosus TaxID=2682096 RepID=A0A844QFB9_9HYPH|nr:hypothetical protein [Nitratireductor arenosus]MVA97975.1 hypothetical protein [Nitratireductor arenosus]